MYTPIVTTIGPEVNAESCPENYIPIIEYFEPKYGLLIRAKVIGFYFVNGDVFLTVHPVATSCCGMWVGYEDDGTTLSICAAKMIGQVG